MSDTVIIEPYNEQWPEMFNKEKIRLTRIIAPWLVGSIEHVGSTAVKGLSAKPIIDIMVGVKSLNESIEAISALEKNGYCFYPYKADVMHWFCRPSPDCRTHHLHLIPYRSALWHERINFRDKLKSSPKLVKEYQHLKLVLAAEYKDDRELYTQNKWPFIKRVLATS